MRTAWRACTHSRWAYIRTFDAPYRLRALSLSHPWSRDSRTKTFEIYCRNAVGTYLSGWPASCSQPQPGDDTADRAESRWGCSSSSGLAGALNSRAFCLAKYRVLVYSTNIRPKTKTKDKKGHQPFVCNTKHSINHI